MTSIRADLTSLTRDGLLRAYLDRLSGADDLRPSSRLIVFDSAGGNEAYAAVVRQVKGDVLLLEVDWDNEHALEIEPSESAGLAVGLIQFGSFSNVSGREPERTTQAIQVPATV